MPVITGVHHFALTVSDVDRAVAFYGDFGLEVVADREVAGDYVEQITGVPGAKVRICHLSGHGHNLELLQYLAPPGAPRARRLQDVGSAHLCFLTDDLDAQCEWLRERGIRFRSPGRHRPPPPGDEPLRRLESLRSSSVELQLRLPT